MSEKLFMLATNRLINGQHVSLMPEGTNSASNELTALPFSRIKSGVVKIAQYATDSHSFVVPIGIHYRTPEPRKAKLPRHAAVAIGDPITTYADNALDIRHQIHDGMQNALNIAVEHTRR